MLAIKKAKGAHVSARPPDALATRATPATSCLRGRGTPWSVVDQAGASRSPALRSAASREAHARPTPLLMAPPGCGPRPAPAAGPSLGHYDNEIGLLNINANV